MSPNTADFDRIAVYRIVSEGLIEDIGPGDATTEALIPPGTNATATLVAKDTGVLAGGAIVEILYEIMGVDIAWDWQKAEGSRFCCNDVLCRFSGAASGILTGERVALNLLQRLSGIAFTTSTYVRELEGTGVMLLDTRKTTPALRELEKYAVRVGGGTNHRRGLYDRLLIKDNHLAVVPDPAEAVRRARDARPDLVVEIEVVDLPGLERALSAGPDWVLLDNMETGQLQRCVAKRNACPPPRPQLEASGGVTLETIREIALTGVDAVSVGALTHSAPWIDISLEVAF